MPKPLLQTSALNGGYGGKPVLQGVDIDVNEGEIVAIIGDNGAGKSTLIKCLSGAESPDTGEVLLNGEPVQFSGPASSRAAGIETVYQTLAVSPSLDIASNLYLGRERRRPGILGSVFRMLDDKGMRRSAVEHLNDLGILTVQNMKQPVETLSGGQRQAVAVARAAAFGKSLIVLDEPTAALGVRESGRVLDLIQQVRDRGLPVIVISHNMPHVFEIADRIHVQRLGRRVAQIKPGDHSMAEVVAIMTGALQVSDGKAVVADQGAAEAIGLS